MKRVALIACAAVLSLSSASFAALSKVVTVNGVFASATSGTGSASSINTANLAALDGVTGITLSGGASGGTVTVDFVLGNPVSPGGETPFLLWATTATNATLTGLVVGVGDSGSFVAAGTASPAPNLAMVGGGVTNRFVGVYTGGGNGNIPAYTTFRATFTLLAGGTLAIDQVSNPEPGTWALFAFGLAGMGAFAWRRRNAAKLALAKSAS